MGEMFVTQESRLNFIITNLFMSIGLIKIDFNDIWPAMVNQNQNANPAII